jgi:predicted DNA-binding protein
MLYKEAHQHLINVKQLTSQTKDLAEEAMEQNSSLVAKELVDRCVELSDLCAIETTLLFGIVSKATEAMKDFSIAVEDLEQLLRMSKTARECAREASLYAISAELFAVDSAQHEKAND